MKTTDRINEIYEMYGNNAERIIAVAEALGCKTDSWYVAAHWIAQKCDEYAKQKLALDNALISTP